MPCSSSFPCLFDFHADLANPFETSHPADMDAISANEVNRYMDISRPPSALGIYDE